ncbi:MAG: oligopeptide transporter, OPT family [Candidatus Zixiibacteriota bacterium]
MADRNTAKQGPKPLVPATESPAEFTLKAIISGILFGVLFGAANAYLGLKAGLTVSTSIPIAVMTVAAFRALRIAGSRSTILESNMSQTIGSASSSLASGVIFTVPALFLWGAHPTLAEITLLAMCGGLLGTAMMIPLRRFLIVREHANLPYPEGTACAEVLEAAEGKSAQAKPLFTGLGLGALYKSCTGFLHLWEDSPSTGIIGLPKAQIGIEATPALLGVGFILGPRTGAVMVAGAAISWVLLIPLLAYLWGDANQPIFPEAVKLVRDMSTGEIWSRYIRYLGAGAVAMAGIVTIIKSIPTMVESFQLGFSELTRRKSDLRTEVLRTERDLSMRTVALIVLAIALGILAIPHLVGGFDSVIARGIVALCICIFSFFFVTVSSRIVGLIGVSSNPTSGMTIVTLLGTSFAFYALGWTDLSGRITALSIGTVVCVAASIAGDMSQDLKTGFLLGATPSRQQIGEFIGALTSAGAVAYAVTVLHGAYGFGSTDLPAPQATLMKTVVEGVLAAEIPWTLVLVGAAFALVVEALRIPSLPFAVGLYLPVSTMTPIFAGGMVRWLVDRRYRHAASNPDKDRGVLLSSGLIGGEGLIGVGIAAWTYFAGKPAGVGDEWLGPFSGLAALALFGGLAWVLARRGTSQSVSA